MTPTQAAALDLANAILAERGEAVRHRAQGAATLTEVTAAFSMQPLTDATPRRAFNPPGKTERLSSAFVLVRATDLGQADGLETLKADDTFLAPGHVIGRPSSDAVTLRVGRNVRLVERAYWTAEVHP